MLVDRAGGAPPAHRVPALPVDHDLRCFHLELLLETGAKLGRPDAELAVAMQLSGLAIGRPEPFDRLAPRPLEGAAVDSRAQPAPAVQEVVALLHQHLAQPVLQDLDGTTDAALDHRREGRVQDRSEERRVGKEGRWGWVAEW